MADEKHLWNRGRNKAQQNWYLRLPIPRKLRKQWPFKSKGGKDLPLIIQPLNTGDLRVAQRKRDELTVAYRREVFDRLELGEVMTPDQIKAAVSLDVEAVAQQHKAWVLSLFSRFPPGLVEA